MEDIDELGKQEWCELCGKPVTLRHVLKASKAMVSALTNQKFQKKECVACEACAHDGKEAKRCPWCTR